MTDAVRGLGRLRAKDYLAWVRGLPCALCGGAPPNTAHHVIRQRDGGRAENTVPLCVDCHRALHGTGPARKFLDGRDARSLGAYARALRARYATATKRFRTPDSAVPTSGVTLDGETP